MADKTLRETFTDIANAIRSKSGIQTGITPANMSTAILNLPSGGVEKPLIAYAGDTAQAVVDSALLTSNDALDHWTYTITDNKLVVTGLAILDGHQPMWDLDQPVILRSQYTINGTVYETYLGQSSYGYFTVPHKCIIEYLRLSDPLKTIHINLQRGGELIIQNSVHTSKVIFSLYDHPVHLLAIPHALELHLTDVPSLGTVGIEYFYYHTPAGFSRYNVSDYSELNCIKYLMTEPKILDYISRASDTARSWEVFVYCNNRSFEDFYYDHEMLPVFTGSIDYNHCYYNIYTNYYDENHSSADLYDQIGTYGQEIVDDLYDGEVVVVDFNIYNYNGNIITGRGITPSGQETPGT